MKLVRIFKLKFSLLFTIALMCNCVTVEDKNTADVIVYGGTSAGIAAAIQTARLGKSVILIEPTNRLGGLTTGGLGQTDIGNKQVIGGISREFYSNIKEHYQDDANWVWQNRSEYRDGGQTRSTEHEDAMWTFEPSAALKVFHGMIKGLDIKVVYQQRINRETGVEKVNNAITSIIMESGEAYHGKMFIDASYEGDLMAVAGISYTVGRESNTEYGESLNGVQAQKYGKTLLGTISHNSVHHDFIDGVDPYIVKDDPSSGLLAFISDGGPGIEGRGDKGIQAYCFRMTLTDHPENRIEFAKPDDYNESDYELLFRNYEAASGPIEEMYAYGDPLVPWINSSMPNRKTDTNNQKGFSTDFIGQNWDYPEASYEERERIVDRHRKYQQGLMWTLAYHPRIPEKVREKVSKWGTCKDEYEREDGWQQQLYIREARRMISEYVMTQKNCEGINTVDDAIGMAAYGMDSHHIKRYVNRNGYVANEGNVEAGVKAPFPISYRSIVPKKEECSNLVVPVCLSASHIAFGSIRMEPVFMTLGQSSAIIANLSIDQGKAVQELDYNRLKNELINQGQILE
nr:FAD-dependent oxidoreductase [Allomuricauda sp.]